MKEDLLLTAIFVLTLLIIFAGSTFAQGALSQDIVDTFFKTIRDHSLHLLS